jgi:outer membrane biosynthesis protein TonB
MRLIEFASAEEQLGLWRIISDKVWAELKALSLQQTQAAQQAAIMQTGARAKRATGAVKPTKPAKPTRPSKPAKPTKQAKPAKPVKPQKAPTAPPKLSPPSKTPKAPLKRPSRALSIRDKLTSPPIATRSTGVRAPLPTSQPILPPMMASAYSPGAFSPSAMSASSVGVGAVSPVSALSAA